MLMDYLPEHAKFDEHQYAIIDRVLFSHLPEPLPVIELVSPLLAPQARLYPYLLPLRAISGTQWRSLMAEIQQASDPVSTPLICLLLKSTLSPSEVRNSLLDTLITEDEQRQNHVLRFYDPRVLFHLHWMLTPWEFSNRFNTREITVWTFWLEGQWHSLEYSQPAPFDRNRSKTAFAQIQRIGLINRVLAEQPLITDLAVRQQTSQRVDALLVQCPLTTLADQVAFATQGLLHGDDFWRSAKITALLAESQNSPGYYARLTSSWDDADWQEMTRKDYRQMKGSFHL
ncbi:DUF4123 domain-containing protein [Serratia sp. D1N4]